MPVLNTGLVPGGAVGAELTAATRRAVVPALFVQIYKATPMLNLLFGTAQRAKGGMSQVTVPVQGSSFVNFAWTDYSGGFPQPAVQPGMQNEPAERFTDHQWSATGFRRRDQRQQLRRHFAHREPVLEIDADYCGRRSQYPLRDALLPRPNDRPERRRSTGLLRDEPV